MSIGVGKNVRVLRRRIRGLKARGRDYTRAGELIVERAFEIVLELVQKHLCIWGRDDRAFTRYVAAEDSAARRCPLLGMEAAHELHLGLGAQENLQRPDLI
jgi:hypothetical protein